MIPVLKTSKPKLRKFKGLVQDRSLIDRPSVRAHSFMCPIYKEIQEYIQMVNKKKRENFFSLRDF